LIFLGQAASASQFLHFQVFTETPITMPPVGTDDPRWRNANRRRHQTAAVIGLFLLIPVLAARFLVVCPLPSAVADELGPSPTQAGNELPPPVQRMQGRFRLSGQRGAVQPQNWPRLRGSSAGGFGGNASIVGQLSAEAWAWSADLPGIGHASPVVQAHKIFVTSADPETAARIISCYRLDDGQLLWQVERQATRDHHHAQNSLASSSPVVDDAAVYWSWASAERLWVEAYSHEGQRLWQVSTGPYLAEHGYAASLAIWDRVVIVPMDQDGPSSIVGLDRQTGQQLWRLPRQAARTSYATPLVVEGNTPAVIVSSMSHGLTALDPRNGHVLWERSCFPRRTVSSPIRVDDLLISTCGEGGGNNLLVALRLGERENGIPVIAYQLDRSVAPYVPTPLATEQRLYLWGDRGVVTCVDPATGSVSWRGRVGGRYSSSPIVLGQTVLNVSADGEVVVIADADRFEVLDRGQLGEPSRATPAVADGRIVFRGEGRLFAADLRKQPPLP
jgi:outer membrane protein assembly factor BamB